MRKMIQYAIVPGLAWWTLKPSFMLGEINCGPVYSIQIGIEFASNREDYFIAIVVPKGAIYETCQSQT